MKTPTEFELHQLKHLYDAVYAKQYYERTKKLKGRKPGTGEKVHTYEDGSSEPVAVFRQKTRARNNNGVDPRTGLTFEKIHKNAVAKQRQDLTERVKGLEDRLKKLDAAIAEKEREAAGENRKAKADANTAAKEKDKPKTAAEKAESARENEKYRKKNQQKLKNDSKKESSSTTDSKPKTSSGSGGGVAELKILATSVRGKIAVAKQKLAAL